jgi:N-acyl homoserine lactone hydrolase
MRLYSLDTGLIESLDFALWSPNAESGERRAMSVRSYLIVHPRGTVLWDTGIDDAVARHPHARRIADSILFRVPRTLRGQLAEIGVAPGDARRCLRVVGAAFAGSAASVEASGFW